MRRTPILEGNITIWITSLLVTCMGSQKTQRSVRFMSEGPGCHSEAQLPARVAMQVWAP